MKLEFSFDIDINPSAWAKAIGLNVSDGTVISFGQAMPIEEFEDYIKKYVLTIASADGYLGDCINELFFNNKLMKNNFLDTIKHAFREREINDKMQ